MCNFFIFGNATIDGNKAVLKGNSRAFSLVELLVVITILAILSTLSVISFRGYLSSTRDASRVATLKEVENGLTQVMFQTGKYPIPDSAIEVEASGSFMFYQGDFGTENAKNINMSPLPIDPLNNTLYHYSVSKSRKSFELLAFFESDTTVSLIPQTRAEQSNNPIVLGKNVGLILDSQMQLPPAVNGRFDILSDSATGKYILYLKYQEPIQASGSILFSSLTTLSDDFPENLDTAGVDSTLLASYDMETMVGESGSIVLKDFSSSQANATCYATNVPVSCASNQGPSQTGGWRYPKKALSFDGMHDSLSFGNTTPSILNVDMTGYTILFVAKIPNQTSSLFLASTQTYPMYYLGFGEGKITNLVIHDSMNVFTDSHEIPQGEYFFGALVFGNNTLKTYINGKEEGSLDLTPIASKVTMNDIALPNVPTQIFKGDIDMMKVYHRRLSIGEIQNLYQTLKP